MNQPVYTYVMGDFQSRIIKVGKSINVAVRERQHNAASVGCTRAAIEAVIKEPISLWTIAKFNAHIVPEWTLIKSFERIFSRPVPHLYEWFRYDDASELECSFLAILDGNKAGYEERLTDLADENSRLERENERLRKMLAKIEANHADGFLDQYVEIEQWPAYVA